MQKASTIFFKPLLYGWTIDYIHASSEIWRILHAYHYYCCNGLFHCIGNTVL